MSAVTNWFNTIQCAEHSAEEPESEEELREILRNSTRFLSPIRPVGSLHSMTECIAARAPGRRMRLSTSAGRSAISISAVYPSHTRT